MAGSIQGLTVIINGDATKLTKAMREARAEAGIMTDWPISYWTPKCPMA